MKEIIESITEATWDDNNYDGLVVKTNLQEIQIGIENSQHCCETFGALITNDDTEEFIGAEVLGVTLTDTALNVIDWLSGDFRDGGIQFVNIETNKGTLQYAVYNEHNGYYGHEIQVKSKQLQHSDYL